MRKERKVILDKLEELERQESAEMELGCGFFTNEIHEAFEKASHPLEAQLAATYGMSLSEYNNNMMEIAMNLPSGLPFN